MARRDRHPRAPFLVFGSLTVVILVLLAALAVTTATTAPPAIAEYAPQSIQQIKKPPPDQTSDFGQLGGAPVGKPSPTPTPTPTKTPEQHRLRLLECVGHPPRQIADPQAPPCIASWQGSNGGATSRGVTANEIRVYMPSEFGVGNEYARTMKDLEVFFNRHFEFYGRTLNLEPTATGGGSEPSATGTCADIGAQADWVAKQLDVFAAGDNGSDSCWYNALARNHVISLSGQSTELRQDQESLAPYLWSYPMVSEDLIGNVGDFICSQLAGKKAIYSPNQILKRETRAFGVIVSATQTQTPTPTGELTAALARCGVHLKIPPVIVKAESSDNAAQNTQDTAQWTNVAQNAVLKMRTAGVTTVICMCQLQAAAVMSAFATVQGFHPEWIAERSDQNFLAQAWVPTERNSLLEVSSYPRQVAEAQTPFLHALNEVDPGFCDCSTSLAFDFGEIGYWQLLMLASGIQMAGPHLTPQTFARALQRTRFPNPDDPLYEGSVGFAAGHSMENDVTVAWWNPSAASPVHLDPPGSWCYAMGGRRIRPGHWPKKSILPPSLGGARCVT